MSEDKKQAARYNLIGRVEETSFKTTVGGSPCLFFKLRRGKGKNDFVRCAAFDAMAIALKDQAGETIKMLGIWEQHRIGYKNNMPVKAQRFKAFWFENQGLEVI